VGGEARGWEGGRGGEEMGGGWEARGWKGENADGLAGQGSDGAEGVREYGIDYLSGVQK
jgi:hypothetical protein